MYIYIISQLNTATCLIDILPHRISFSGLLRHALTKVEVLGTKWPVDGDRTHFHGCLFLLQTQVNNVTLSVDVA